MLEVLTTGRVLAQWNRWLVFAAVNERRTAAGQLRDDYRVVTRRGNEPPQEKRGKPRTHRIGIVYAETQRDAMKLTEQALRNSPRKRGIKIARMESVPLTAGEYGIWLREIADPDARKAGYRPSRGPCVDEQGHAIETFVPNL